jgi:hypothetical protein
VQRNSLEEILVDLYIRNILRPQLTICKDMNVNLGIINDLNIQRDILKEMIIDLHIRNAIQPPLKTYKDMNINLNIMREKTL